VFTSSGVKVASTPRRFPSSVSLATCWMSACPRPRKRSTAFITTCGLAEIFTTAMARTLRAMPTLV
jgi:hypothetical protein